MGRTDSVMLDPAAVEAARRNRSLTRQEVAKASRLCNFTVWCGFRARPISLRSAKRLSRALGVDVGTLILAQAAGSQGGAELAQHGEPAAGEGYNLADPVGLCVQEDPR